MHGHHLHILCVNVWKHYMCMYVTMETSALYWVVLQGGGLHGANTKCPFDNDMIVGLPK